MLPLFCLKQKDQLGNRGFTQKNAVITPIYFSLIKISLNF